MQPMRMPCSVEPGPLFELVTLFMLARSWEISGEWFILVCPAFLRGLMTLPLNLVGLVGGFKAFKTVTGP